MFTLSGSAKVFMVVSAAARHGGALKLQGVFDEIQHWADSAFAYKANANYPEKWELPLRFGDGKFGKYLERTADSYRAFQGLMTTAEKLRDDKEFDLTKWVVSWLGKQLPQLPQYGPTKMNIWPDEHSEKLFVNIRVNSRFKFQIGRFKDQRKDGATPPWINVFLEMPSGMHGANTVVMNKWQGPGFLNSEVYHLTKNFYDAFLAMLVRTEKYQQQSSACALSPAVPSTTDTSTASNGPGWTAALWAKDNERSLKRWAYWLWHENQRVGRTIRYNVVIDDGEFLVWVRHNGVIIQKKTENWQHGSVVRNRLALAWPTYNVYEVFDAQGWSVKPTGSDMAVSWFQSSPGDVNWSQVVSQIGAVWRG